MPDDVPVRIHAPRAVAVTLVTYDRAGDHEVARAALERQGDEWVGSVPDGTVYGLVAEGVGPRFDRAKVLVDPEAREVVFPPGFERRAAAEKGRSNAGRAPLAVARQPPPTRPPRPTERDLVVYEAHVRGMTRGRGGETAPGTYRALTGQLDRLAALGFSVLELMPIHQGDPQEGSYWGYMPLVFGAVHRQYAATDDPAGELADLVAAAHDRDIEVWVDVVFNHTTEVDVAGPTYNLRGLADDAYYRLDADGAYIETTGCGNDLDAESRAAQRLVIESLDRFADLGVDGFRFDLAPVLGRHASFVAALDAWAVRRGVRMIAEPWDAAGHHQLGRAWPGVGWMQWNDRFRDDMRGFLRAEPGLAGAFVQRVQGSPDVFDAPLHSVNFLTCHDGFTLHDLVAYDAKHNDANGHGNADGAGDNRSWNCGWEGEDGAPDGVLELRRRQLRNAWCLLAMSHGVPMVAMGDEFGRTQGGNNNAYNQDNPTSWVDWDRRDRFTDIERFVAMILAVRRRHAELSQAGWWGATAQWFGVDGPLDAGESSRSLAWRVGGLYVMVNTHWEPRRFTIRADGPWVRVVDTSLAAPDDIVEVAAGLPVAGAYDVGDRAVVILEHAVGVSGRTAGSTDATG